MKPASGESLPCPAVDDERLAWEARRSQDAFGELFRRHFQRVYRYHMSKTGCADEAEDLTSQTFMAALENIAADRADGSFAAWLLGIARRKAAQYVQPAWRFTGHYTSGEEFEILVQALFENYLQHE